MLIYIWLLRGDYDVVFFFFLVSQQMRGLDDMNYVFNQMLLQLL